MLCVLVLAQAHAGLIGHWDFEEGSGTTTADTGAAPANHGTLSGATFSSARTSGAYSMHFNAPHNYVAVSDEASLNPAAAISIAAWVFADGNNTLTGNPRILQKGTGDDQYRLTYEGGLLKFDLRTSAGTRIATTSPPSQGVWHHIAGTYDGTAIRLYVDGVQVAGSTFGSPASIASTSAALAIGNKLPGGPDSWQGDLDDVRLYDHALSAAELAALYQARPSVTTGAATNVTSTSATLNGSVNPNGAVTTAHFEYGPTPALGSVTANQNVGSGTSAVTVSANLTGLIAGTTYYYRLVAGITSSGPGLTFRTPAAGDLDLSFGGPGKVVTTVGTGNDLAHGVAVQADGKAIVVGEAWNGTDEDFALVRYNTDGTLDASFGGTGKVLTNFGSGRRDFGQGVAIQSDGRIVVVGISLNGTNNDIAVARYKSDGTLDTSFGTGGKQVYDRTGNTDVAYGVVVQPDGKIMVAGYSYYAATEHDFAWMRLTSTGTVELSVDTPVGSGTSSDFAYAMAVQSDGKVILIGETKATPSTPPRFAVVRYNTDGSLDGTFGGTGKVTTMVGSAATAHSVALQSDGKIVVAGEAYNGSNDDIAVVRYNSNGTLDTGFGSGGALMTGVGSSGDEGYTVAIQGDGKIVVAGVSNSGTSDDFAVVRYTTTGVLDSTFGGTGKVAIPIGNVGEAAQAIALQGDGRLIVAGYSGPGGSLDFATVRVNTDGMVDPHWGGWNGKVTTPVGLGGEQVHGLAVQSDGKIIVTGETYNGSNSDFVVARYLSDGTLDATFGGGGKVTTAMGTGNDYSYAIALQSDGRIVVAGQSNNGSNDDFAVARYFSDGTLDVTFGTGGKVITSIGSANDYARSVAVQADGKIVVAGQTGDAFGADIALVRYNANGMLDASFGSGGKVTTAIGSGQDVGASVAVQSDGKIVVAGTSDDANNTGDFALVRYNANGSLDTSFNGTGKVTTPGTDYGFSVAVQGDGKIVVGGYASNGTNADLALVRYNANGSLDTSFNGTGKATTAIGSGDDIGTSVAVQNDGRIVAAAYFSNGSDNDFALVRYNANGTLDTAFGNAGKVQVAVGTGQDVAFAAALQSDGKVVVGGYANNGANNDFAVVRVLADMTTLGPTLNSPATNASCSTPLAVSFTLPEAALSGSVQLSFTGTASRTLTLAASQEASGTHSFSLSTANLAGAAEVASVTGGTTLPDGTYTVTLSYRDLAGNAVASATATNVLLDTIGPTGGTMTLTPGSPVDASAALTVDFAGWTDASLPLSYAVLVDDIVVSPVGPTASRNLTGPAASGTHTLKGRIADALGQITEVTQNFTVLTAQESWRRTYFGITTNTGNAADTADPDGDGGNNLFEFVAGLVPNDPTSRFALRIERVAAQPGQKAIIFSPVLAGRTYVVKYKVSLTDPAWMTLTNITTTNNGTERTVTDLNAGTGPKFYLVEITKP